MWLNQGHVDEKIMPEKGKFKNMEVSICNNVWKIIKRKKKDIASLGQNDRRYREKSEAKW